MKWARISKNGGPALVGVVEGDHFFPRVALGAEDSAGAAIPLAEARLLAPAEPGNFICLWNNFRQLAAKNSWQEPAHPLFLLKPSASLSGTSDVVAVPPSAGRIMFEGELGIVIGRACTRVSTDEAEAAILGYTCVNDLTAIDLLNESSDFLQWTRAKGLDGFGAIGPMIVTGLNWRELVVRVILGGRERQSYQCSDMIMSPPQIVSRISMEMSLRPGDIIACGTSIGSRPVKMGEPVTVFIEGIGELTTTLEAIDTGN
ncbi:MAG TPA: fumarylacetoacetate hydrolase family protein [Mesorhizobium sp.]|jgi:2-keto-4-pentenoate hydratase/2-oxohepta-3-ene-1,7-dioic acid hydratase in catechol pathway|uniref:fumarylacetoacetate hydrolase family protein n=1 Tax=Mesorhizobium sp. TaxID=1871066 RepID=UPI002DDCAF09|nr:fumarylacetoacetate hydrolase family protein [Mesorhizobium sp.]HEV2501818.1 fumarylacetoacetate hydrolase family protein [Mesorhizobium sp.]